MAHIALFSFDIHATQEASMRSTLKIRAATTVAALATLVVAAAGPVAAQTTPGAESASPSAGFAALDKNKDGYISKAEARKDKGLTKQWDSADSNKDGKLDPTEFAQFEATPSGDEGAAGKPSATDPPKPPIAPVY
jgi:hypothetical protein